MKERINKIIREHSKKLVELYYNGKPKWIEAAEKDFINAIKKELIPQWIPVSERLPEVQLCVILKVKMPDFDGILLGCLRDDGYYEVCGEGIEAQYVTDWMEESELKKLLPEGIK